jgi:RNA 2',3'-cyclic 3'-phosphodiesterase
MRLFIAVGFSEEIKVRILEVQSRFAAACQEEAGRVRWVVPAQFHITLKFLGERPEHMVPAIGAALEAELASVPGFSIELGGVGTFPRNGPIDSFWLGMTQGTAEVEALAARVTQAMDQDFRLDNSKPFTPHMTLGRVGRQKISNRMRASLHVFETGIIGPVRVESVALMRSVLSATGSSYTVLKTIRLG